MSKILWAIPMNEGQKGKQIFLAAFSVDPRAKELEYYRSIPMPDDLTKKGVQDDIRINVNQAWERQYWAKKFGVTQKRLREMVKMHGVLVRDVKGACGTKDLNAKPQ